MPPIINAAHTNKPPSARMLPAIGAPMRVSSRSTRQSGGSMRAKKSNARYARCRRMYVSIARNISHSEIAVATPQPTAPSCGMPNLPYMKIQLPMTFAVRPRKPKYMIGLVRPRPSLV